MSFTLCGFLVEGALRSAMLGVRPADVYGAWAASRLLSNWALRFVCCWFVRERLFMFEAVECLVCKLRNQVGAQHF